MKWLLEQKGSAESRSVGAENLVVAVGGLSLHEATTLLRELVADISGLTDEEKFRRSELIREAQAGAPEAEAELKHLIDTLMNQHGIEVRDMAREAAIKEIYDYNWGLDVLEDLYRDPEIDEIRVSRPDMVTVQRRGKNEHTQVRFKDDYHVEKLIRRLVMHDVTGIDRSTPRVESKRRDGTRITGTLPPFSTHPTLTLRRFDSFTPTWENLVRHRTANERLLRLVTLLPRGQANILISGGTGSGKTALLRFLAGFLHPSLRIVTLEPAFELDLERHFPDRDIVAFQECERLGITLKEAFRTTLRQTPDVIIVGEVRDREIAEVIKAGLRGHNGNLTTVHTNDGRAALDMLVDMRIEAGSAMPVDVLRRQVAQAFDVVIQMFGDSKCGKRIIERVMELGVDEDGRVNFRDLCIWKPSSDGYFQGDWDFPNSPSERLLQKLRKHGVSESQIKEALRP